MSDPWEDAFRHVNGPSGDSLAEKAQQQEAQSAAQGVGPVLFREHRGGLAESMETVREMPTEHALRLYAASIAGVSPADIVIESYGGPDARIGWPDVQVVAVRRAGLDRALGFLSRPFPAAQSGMAVAEAPAPASWRDQPDTSLVPLPLPVDPLGAFGVLVVHARVQDQWVVVIPRDARGEAPRSPLLADVRGQFPACWLPPGRYRLTLTMPDPEIVRQWEVML